MKVLNKEDYKMKSKLLFSVLAFVMIFTVACNSNKYKVTEEVSNFVQFTMEDGKEFVVELYPDKVPVTVKNFQDLVAKNFYDGLILHRIEKDFVLQGGDPDGNGTGGPGYGIVGEFLMNGFDNPIKHKKGTLSMARAEDYNSAGSQFFVCLNDKTASGLDGLYAAFGDVVHGLDNVMAIEKDFLNSGGKDYPTIKSVDFVVE